MVHCRSDRLDLRELGYRLLLGLASGPSWFADAGFEPGGQIFEMTAPAAVDGGVVVIPVLTFADASVDEMETCAIVFRCQCKGDRGGARLKGSPAIAEAMGRVEHEDLAKLDQVRSPLEPDRAPRAQIDLGGLHKPAFQICFLCQSLEDALWGGVDEEFFLK